MSLTKKQFQRYLDRDGGMCFHCGRQDDTLVPGHRYGRGMGGSKLRDVPSNIVTMCSWLNNAIETDSPRGIARGAAAWGLKLGSGQQPLTALAFHIGRGSWVRLDDAFGIEQVMAPHPTVRFPA